MSPPGARRAAAVVAAVVAVLGLSGCFKASQDVKVRADGSGSLTLHASVDKAVLAALATRFDLGPLGAGPALFQPVDRTFPDGTRVRVVDGPDRATLDASFDFDGPDQYRRKLQEVTQAVSPNPDASLPDGSLRVRRVDDRLEVTLDVGGASSEAVDLSALTGLVSPDQQPEVVVTLTMPGRILSSNGRARGRTVTWDLLDRGTPSNLTASSTLSRPGVPSWAVPAGAGLVLALLLLIVGLLLRRGHPADGAAGADPAGPWPRGHPGTFFPPSGPASRTDVGWPAPPAPPAPAAPPIRPEPPAWPTAPRDTRPLRRGPDVPPPEAGGGPPGPAGAAEPPAGSGPDIGSAMPVTPVAGWYVDPAGGGGLRYWDGLLWTSHTR